MKQTKRKSRKTKTVFLRRLIKLINSGHTDGGKLCYQYQEDKVTLLQMLKEYKEIL